MAAISISASWGFARAAYQDIRDAGAGASVTGTAPRSTSRPVTIVTRAPMVVSIRGAQQPHAIVKAVRCYRAEKSIRCARVHVGTNRAVRFQSECVSTARGSTLRPATDATRCSMMSFDVARPTGKTSNRMHGNPRSLEPIPAPVRYRVAVTRIARTDAELGVTRADVLTVSSSSSHRRNRASEANPNDGCRASPERARTDGARLSSARAIAVHVDAACCAP